MLSWWPRVLVHEAGDSGRVLTQQRGTQCKAAACRELRAPSATGKQDHPPPHPQQRALSPPAADAASLSAHQHTLRWEINPGEVGRMNTEQSVFASSSRVSSHEFFSFRATRSRRKLNIWTQVFVAQTVFLFFISFPVTWWETSTGLQPNARVFSTEAAGHRNQPNPHQDV